MEPKKTAKRQKSTSAGTKSEQTQTFLISKETQALFDCVRMLNDFHTRFCDAMADIYGRHEAEAMFDVDYWKQARRFDNLIRNMIWERIDEQLHGLNCTKI